MRRQYPDTVSSGYPWIGEVPEHWGLNRIGQLFQQRSSKVSDKDYPALSVTKSGILPQMEHVAKTDDNDNRKLVKAGDFVINSRSDRKGSSGIARMDGSVSLINTVLQIRGGLAPTYCHHLLRSTAFQEEFYRMGSGLVADLWSTNFSSMKNIRIPQPPLSEQTAIANFLDRETTQIDGLIEKKGRFIALLKEKRAAVITHAVTKGVDPEVAMKDACAPWIEAIPAHWDQKPFYAVARARKIKNKGMQEDNLLSLSYGNIVRKDINTPTGLLPESFETYQIVEANDVVFRLTDLQNDKRSLRSAICSERGIITSAYLAAQTEGFQPAFLNYLMRAYDVQKVFYSMGGGMRQSLGYEDIRRMPVVVPPIEEQTVIATFLDRETTRIDTLISKTTHSIDLLKEKRSALITAAVTGKIDVRNAA